MANLDLTKEQIESEIFVNADGVRTATIRGAARIANVSEATLRRHFSGTHKNGSGLNEILVENGFDPRDFSQSGIPESAVNLIVKYYAWMAGARCTERARKIEIGAGGTKSSASYLKNIGKSQKPKAGPVSKSKSNSKKQVYLIQCQKTKAFKIGISSNPEKRLKSLQTGSPWLLKIVCITTQTDKTARTLEQDLHRALGHFRLNGEWFDCGALQMLNLKEWILAEAG